MSTKGESSVNWGRIIIDFQEEITTNINMQKPPARSENIVSDFRSFFLHVPETKTFVEINSEEDRKKYSQLIFRRTGIGVDKYRMLNIHRIRIDAPSKFIFEELMTWDGNSSWWPNYIAKANLVNGSLENIKITLFGFSQNIFKLRNGIFGYHLLHLFNLNAIKIQKDPDSNNGRLLLYRCSGGYPIGVFAMYARDSIAEQDEAGMSQLFIVVGFNFYGNKNLSNLNLLNRTWEKVHNKVTANVMDKIKLKCEWNYNYLKRDKKQ